MIIPLIDPSAVTVSGVVRNPSAGRPLDRVGGVAAAAESDLQHAEIGRRPSEQQEGSGGGDLEHRDRRASIRAFALLQRSAQFRSPFPLN